MPPLLKRLPRTVCVVPARAGSKGIPNKNTTLLSGRPLIQWTLDAIKLAGVTHTLVTTDSQDVVKATKGYNGVQIIDRPPEMAKDDVHAFYPTLHAIDQWDVPDSWYVLMLLPTSPFRSYHDIQEALKICESDRSVIGVCESNPLHVLRYINSDGYLDGLASAESSEGNNLQRQNVRQMYVVNGAIFVAHAGTLRRHRSFHIKRAIPYIMPPYRSLDINTKGDYYLARLMSDYMLRGNKLNI